MRRLSDRSRSPRGRAAGGEAIVIGSGFIGCEVAGSLACARRTVTLVSEERLPQVVRLGEEAAERIAAWLREVGVTLLGGVSVAAIENARAVALRDGRRLEGDCVVLATGVRPRSELADASWARPGQRRDRGRSAMRSSDPAILAVGDVALADNPAAGRASACRALG